MSIPTSLPEQLVWVMTDLHRRGWTPGTGGNFSAVLKHNPLELIMSPSGADKGLVTVKDLIHIDAQGSKLEGVGEPSAETLLHVAIVELTGASAVLHTHSVANTILSKKHEKDGIITITGFEMLKGLSGVKTHEHHEEIPVIVNTQDMVSCAALVRKLLLDKPYIHGFLLSGHGLYAWGSTCLEARRHIEVLEFLFEVLLKG